MFTSKSINLYLPESLTQDKNITRELDYLLRLFSCFNLNISLIKIKSQKFYIPNHYIKIANEKVKSLEKNLSWMILLYKNLSIEV